MIISSQKYLDWEDQAVFIMAVQKQVTLYPISVTCTFFYDNRRRHDLDNGLASVLDALTAAKVIEDDNVNYVNNVRAVYGGYDKADPRVEIVIE